MLTLLANMCLKLKTFPPFLKTTHTVVLCKPRKSLYKSLNAWRLIMLLKTIGKVIKKLVAKRIRDMAKAN